MRPFTQDYSQNASYTSAKVMITTSLLRAMSVPVATGAITDTTIATIVGTITIAIIITTAILVTTALIVM